ncbi:MAG: hypothetical protein C4539_03900 [Ignavibacteriales bacterium]|nr:MAG: hypothetical protein C4539_03900 [Ignavibacteriales bacterium]
MSFFFSRFVKIIWLKLGISRWKINLMLIKLKIITVFFGKKIFFPGKNLHYPFIKMKLTINLI